MLWTILVLGVGSVIGFCIWDGRRENPGPSCGVYAQPGGWFYLKKIGIYVLLRLRKWRRKRKSERVPESATGRAGYGFKSLESEEDMECPQALGLDKHALDSVYVSGTNSDGAYLVMRIGRRHGRVCELWLSAHIPGLGSFQSPIHPDCRVRNSDGRSFTARGLSLECLEPMRRWKFTFNGLLRKGFNQSWTGKDRNEVVHVKFSFIWEAFTEKFDFDTDMSEWLLADCLAREKWTKVFWSRLQRLHQTHYEQWGEMHGVLQVDGQPELKLSLRGLRDHSYGVRDWNSFHRYAVHIGHLKNGTVFHVSNISIPSTTSFLRCGYLVLPCGTQTSITSTDLHLENLGEDGCYPDNYSFNFTAGGKSYHVKVNAKHTPRYYMQEDWCSVVYEKLCVFTVNGVRGEGVTEACYRHDGESPIPVQGSVPMLGEPEVITENERGAHTLIFKRKPCCSPALVGGKGCQLANLTQMNSKDFIVPEGFCLTIAAFSEQLQKTPELLRSIQNLEAIASGRADGDLRQQCESVVQLFLQTELCGEIQKAIRHRLNTCFTYSEELRFAVRSSAAGEDGSEMSGAGQMDTILGVKGQDEVLKAVTKCWASHFAFQAVEYRRQHGQPIKSSMAVVIQQMVRSEVSGVLFTRDPLTGSPGFMSLNANYGLGESVVSGSSDPDSITLSRAWDDQLSIVKKVIGRKETQITVQETGGTLETHVSKVETSRCCLTDEMILRLATLGIKLEKAFSDPRDIEWAVCGDQIYLLQARPITTLGLETEWELMHEFDTPLASDEECLTTANIGEMMPGAMTPLTQSVFLRAIEFGLHDIQRRIGVIAKPFNLHKFLSLCQGKPFINMMYLHGICEGHVLGNDKRMADLALMGEVQEDLTMDMVRAYWGTSPFLRRLRHGICNFLNMRDSARRTKNWEDAIPSYSLGDHQGAAALYHSINMHLDDLYQVWADTFTNSSRSGAWSTILMAILSQGKTTWEVQYYSDVAMLLSKCDDVYSADVPTALQEMAASIYESGQKDEFTNMSTEEAVRWLQLPESGSVGFKFSSFLKYHGHRCVREADFYEKSWRAAPVKVVGVLQAMVASPRPPHLNRHPQTCAADAIGQIKSPTTTFGRLVLRWALPKARRAVGSREWGKSVSIQFNDIFKEAYWKVAKMMVMEGFLPEEELLFFMTHKEIGKVLKERSSRLIAKAQRRRRLLEKQTKQAFPRINWGHPVPVDDGPEMDDDFVVTSVKLQGMPVSQGHVKGTARVILSLSEATTIQPGDVLIVQSTDVGWSPYFPLISGLVTEIGGLLSHGAVVAREYGLPCVVNVQRATALIKSGDQVILDGYKGTVEKME